MDAHITHGYGGGWRQVGCILLVRSNFLSTCRVSVCCLAVPGPHACRGGRVAVLVSFEPALSFRRCLFRGAFLSLETSKACFLATLGLDTAENYLCFGKWFGSYRLEFLRPITIDPILRPSDEIQETI